MLSYPQVTHVIGGNTSGALATISSGTYQLAGGNNITLSQNGNSVTISAGAGGGGFQSAGFSTQGNTSGDTGFGSQSVQFVGGNNITLSGSTAAGAVTITISGANAGGAQTGISGIQVSDTTYTSGTVTFRNANGISFGSSGANGISASYTVPTQTNQSAIRAFGVSNTGQTAGDTGVSTGIDWVIAGSQSITMSQSTAGGGPNTVWVQHPAWITTAMQSNAATISNIRVSAGTTSNLLSALTFGDSNGISFGLDASTITATYYRPVASNAIQSVGSATGSGTNTSRFAADDHVHAGVFSMGVSNVGNTSGDTRVDVGRFVLAGGNNITLSQATAANGLNTITISAGAGGGGIALANSQTTYTSGTAHLSGAGAITIASTTGQSYQFSVPQTSSLQATGFVSISTNGSTISIGAGPLSFYAVSNITQSSSGTLDGRSLSFNGAGIASVGVSNGSVIVSVPAGGGAGDGGVFAGVSTGGNTAGSTGTVSTGNFVLVGSNGITLSQSTGAAGSAATVTIAGYPHQSYYANSPYMLGTQTLTMLQSTSGMFPFRVDENISFDFMRLVESGSVLAASSTAATTGNTSYTGGHYRSHNLVVYSRGTGANSMSLQSVMSTQLTERALWTISNAANSTQHSYSVRYTFPHSTGTIGFTKDYSSSAASLNFHTSQLTDLTGNKIIDFQWNTSLAPGQYFLGYGVSSTTSTQRTADESRWGVAFTHIGLSQMNSAYGTLGAATNSSVNILPGIGSFSIVGGGTTASVDMTRLSSSASQNVLYFQFMRIA